MVDTKLTTEQTKAIEMLVYDGFGKKSVANILGITVPVINKWFKDKYFIEVYENEKKLAYDEHHARIRGLVGKAIECLETNMDCGLPQVEIAAAKEVLNRAGFAAIEKLEIIGSTDIDNKISAVLEKIRNRKAEEVTAEQNGEE